MEESGVEWRGGRSRVWIVFVVAGVVLGIVGGVVLGAVA